MNSSAFPTLGRMFLLALLICGAAAIAAAPVHAQRNAVDATIRGLVSDENTGTPIAGARVELLDLRDRIRATAETDISGNFVVTGVRPGPFRLRASARSYRRTVTPEWQVESGEVLSVIVRMDPDVVLIAPLEVTARTVTQTPVLAGFRYRLENSIGGTLLSRADIEQRNPNRVTDLLQMVPGVRVQGSAGAMSLRYVSMSRSLPGMGGGSNGCPVQVYLDGVLATRGGQDVSPDELASPLALEGIEVYQGLATIPPEFLTPESRCGVIALWTRRTR